MRLDCANMGWNIFQNLQKQELISYLHAEINIFGLEKLLTCLRDLTAHSSRVSAASSLPCRRYRAPRFLRVVFTVGLDTKEMGKPIFT